jgi:DNA-binding ferritin-like protein
MKTNKEIITELIDIVAEAMSAHGGTSVVMMKPAINMVKIKLSNLSEADSAEMIDKVHWLSSHIEKESGKLSPYHGIEN